MAYKASDLFSGTWKDVVGNTALWQSDQNPTMRGFTLFVEGYDVNINNGQSVLYEGEYYWEWGYVFKDSDLDGIFEINEAYKDQFGFNNAFSYVSSSYDEIIGRYYNTTRTEDRSSDNGFWSRNPNTFDGTFSTFTGDDMGIFEIDVELEFNTTESADYIWGTTGNEILSLGGGNDVVMAREGNDIISGDNGDDKIYGGYGNDNLSGGSGNDILSGGNGNDNIDGGDGTDTAIFSGDFVDYSFTLILLPV